MLISLVLVLLKRPPLSCSCCIPGAHFAHTPRTTQPRDLPLEFRGSQSHCGRSFVSYHLVAKDLETTRSLLWARGPAKQASKTRGPANPFFGLIILLSHNGFAGPRVSSCSSRTWLVLCGPAVVVSAMREGRHWVLSRSCAAFRRLGQ